MQDAAQTPRSTVERSPLLPTSTRILSLARDRRLVLELARALARARGRRQGPLARVLEQAVELARELEGELLEMESSEPDPGTADRVLARTLDLSLKLGPLLKQARELEQAEPASAHV